MNLDVENQGELEERLSSEGGNKDAIAYPVSYFVAKTELNRLVLTS